MSSAEISETIKEFLKEEKEGIPTRSPIGEVGQPWTGRPRREEENDKSTIQEEKHGTYCTVN